ncbi:Fe3+-citrate ABC transporter substrate-binding protein [Mycolicibacterium murale]|uniref:Fe3+-citrate ABC transporter substrate-binding protein n=1 Tax=Mycolicibacterium murale TaxID=182220 RepID=A0A7I9WS88_9MYCO|nr:Fe3+-citrate ABC transporter substrate-binding protein [Mycolicibacterium murale]
MTLVAGCADPQGMTDVQPSRSVITSTTEVADAGVLGNLRRPDDSCPAEPAPVDPGPPTRTVNSGTERGDIEVPADPQRIVALSGAQLDALCALGLQARVVAAALPDGSDQQPAYLGTAIHDLPDVGTRSAPDLAAIAAAGPDLILGGQAPQPSGDYFAIAPTVLMADSADRWQDTVRAVGAATGRRQAADELLGRFADQAAQAGRDNDAQHFQASVVQLTDTGVRIFGAANFPASVLAAVGVDRPATQRFTDSPYIELGSDDDLAAADADLIFVSFASPAARDRAAKFFSGDSWRALSAARDHRVYVVNNEIWQAGDGLIAARGIVDDLRVVNAPIN